MARIELEIDASMLVSMFKAGMEAGFLLAKDDLPEVESELNILGIELTEDGEE